MERINVDFTLGPETGWVENWNAAWDSQSRLDSIKAQQYGYIKYFEPVVDELKRVTGKNYYNPGDFFQEIHASGRPHPRGTLKLNQLDSAEFEPGGVPEGSEPDKYYQFHKHRQILDLALEKNKDSINPKFKIRSLAEIDKVVMDKARASEKKLSEIGQRATTLGTISSFAAHATGAISDELTSPFAPALVLGPSFRMSIKWAALIDGGISLGIVAGELPKMAAWRKKVGLPYTWEQIGYHLGGAFFGGAAFGAFIRGTANYGPVLGRKFRDSLEERFVNERILGRALYQEIDKTPIAEVHRKLMELEPAQINEGLQIIQEQGHLSSDVRGAIFDTEAEAHVNNQNPVVDANEHLNRLDNATDALHQNQNPNMPEMPASPRRVPESVYDGDHLDQTIYRFNPNEIEVDAKLFQFKEGADVAGVTERLRGVTQWDHSKAGQIIVYEFSDGRRFIADGHQRLGLAKRIIKEDPSQDIKLYGTLLRELDGVKPEQAMVIAASTNIAQGTGTIIDAAKILRIDPSQLQTLPPRSALVRDAQALVNLSDEAFGLVRNEIVPANYAALVGRLVKDQEKQLAILKLLSKTEPANLTEAEAIIRQAMEMEFHTETQQGLFGAETITESLFKERAKILDAAIKKLRQDRQVFNTLVDNQKKIEGEGNTLSRDTNIERATTDGQAIQIVQTQANRKGPLSDALSAAAKRFKDTGKSGGPVNDFVEAVRRGAARGDLDGVSVGTEGRNVDVAPEGDRVNAVGREADLEGFSEPNGEGSHAQANTLEAGIREQVTVPGDKAELQNLVDTKASVDQIIKHPSVIKALDDMKAIPETQRDPNFDTPQFKDNRQFNFAGETVVGYEAGISRLYKDMKGFAWTDDGLPFPGEIARDRHAVVIFGPPASGKSFFANPIARKHQAIVIDKDIAKAALPEYEGGIGANATHVESRILTAQVENLAMTKGENIVIPTVGEDLAKARKIITRLKENGYKVDLINMYVPADESFRRMIQRFIEIGRFVNSDHVLSVGLKPTQNYTILKREVNRYANIENESPKGQAKSIIEESGSDVLEGIDLPLQRGGEIGRRIAGQIAEGESPEIRAGTRQETPTTELTPEGEQILIEGVEPVAAVVEPPKPPPSQLPSDFGLFDVGARKQIDLMDLEIPVGTKIVDDVIEPEMQTTRSILEEIEQDTTMLKRLEDCV